MMKITLLLLIPLVLSLSTWQRNKIWKNEYTLWKDVAIKSPAKIVPHINLGNAFIRRAALDYAEREFKTALAINPLDSRVISGLAVIYVKQKHYDEAIRLLEILTSDKPLEAPFHGNLGVAYSEIGLLDKAIAEFKIAKRLDPLLPDVYANLGFAYKKKGMLNEAKQELEQALALAPGHVHAGKNLDEVLRSMNAARR